MRRRRLPIGVQTFAVIRGTDSYYVDKTPWIERLANEGRHFFLSRPRRFGKSLLIDTMKELFEGNEPLFRGLAVHDRWDWSVHRPVLRLGFGSGSFSEPGLVQASVSEQLAEVEREAGIDPVYEFAPELEGLDAEQIQRWYDGYRWGGDHRMYNPFGVLMLFDRREFGAWWFETGSPAFLIETLVRRRVASAGLDQTVTSEDLLSAFDVDHISTEALLFQTGYLTIGEVTTEGVRKRYRLAYPNLEVRQSLNEHLLRRLHPDPARVDRNQSELHRLLEANDVAGLERLFHAFFAGIPHQWHTNNDIASYEGYYASVFYSYFAALGLDVTVEESTSRGRLDMAARAGGRVYLFEFKVVEQAGPGAALAQLKQRRYADRYRSGEEPVHLVGVEFSSTDRNIQSFETEQA